MAFAFSFRSKSRWSRHGALGEPSAARGRAMVTPLAMAALLLLVPATGRPVLARLRELRPGHGVKYQQVSIITVKNCTYKTSVNAILNQSMLRRSSRDSKSFKRNLEVPRKNCYMDCQQTNMLKCVILYRRKLYLIARRSTHISRRHLKSNKHIQGGQSRKMWSTVLNNRRFQVKMKCHSIVNVRIKPDTKRIEESQIYVENKYIENKSSLSCLTLQANIILDATLKCQEVFESIMKLKSKQVLMLKRYINTGMLQMQKYKQYNDQMSDYSKECSVENRNAFDKINYGVFTDRKKAVNSEKEDQYIDFGNYVLSCQSFQWTTSFPIREMMKVWKRKTLTKTNMNENHRFLFVHAHTYQRNRDVQKMFSTHNIMSNVQGNDIFIFRKKIYRNKKLIGKWRKVQMQPSVMHPAFPTIEIAIEAYYGKFNSEVNPAKPSVMMNTLQCLCVCKHISNSPLVVERTKRSAQGETVPVPVDVLKRLTSALTAGATIFGIALFALALTGCYLFDKRRELGQFFDVVLKYGKPKKHTKPSENQSSTPIPVSQRFHLAQPQGSRMNQAALASVTAAEAYSIKGSDFIIIKQIYGNSDSEDSTEMSHDHRGLTVKSGVHVFPSQSSGSIRSFCDDEDDLSSLPSSSDEVKRENHFTNTSNGILKKKESVPQPESSHDNQEQHASGDLLLQLKKTKDSLEPSFSGEITIEDQVSNLSATTPKEKEMFPVIPKPDCLCGNQEQCTSSDTLTQLKKTTDSSQPYLLAEITVEDQFSNLPTTTPEEKELVPVIPKPDCLCGNQEQCTSSNTLTQLKKTTDSSQPYLLAEITVEDQFSNLPTTTPEEKELVPVIPKPDCLCGNQEQCTSSDTLTQLKKTTDSSQPYLLAEITVEDQFSNLPTTTPEEKELVPVIPKPDCLCGNQEQCTSSDTLTQLKKTTDSSQPYLLAEITVEDQFSNLPTTTPEEKELVPVVTQPGYHNQKQCKFGDVPQLKENDLRISSSRGSYASQSLTRLYKCP